MSYLVKFNQKFSSAESDLLLTEACHGVNSLKLKHVFASINGIELTLCGSGSGWVGFLEYSFNNYDLFCYLGGILPSIFNDGDCTVMKGAGFGADGFSNNGLNFLLFTIFLYASYFVCIVIVFQDIYISRCLEAKYSLGSSREFLERRIAFYFDNVDNDLFRYFKCTEASIF